MLKKEPKTYVFIVAVVIVMGLDMLMTCLPNETLYVFCVRVCQSVFLLAWLFYCRESVWFGLLRPDKKAWHVFFNYAGVCGILGVLLVYLWFDMGTLLRLPDMTLGVLGLCLFIVIGPLFEELFFRAFLYRFLRTVAPISVSVLLSASLFALMHGAWLSPQLIGGVIFALAYEQSKNLWVAVALHASANASVAVLVLNFGG